MKAPSRVRARKRASTSAPSTASHAVSSSRQRRRACSGVNRSPGISRNSPRIRRTTSWIPRLDSLIRPPGWSAPKRYLFTASASEGLSGNRRNSAVSVARCGRTRLLSDQLLQRIISRLCGVPPSISSCARTQLSVPLPTWPCDADAGVRRPRRSPFQHRSTLSVPPIPGGRGTGRGTRGESPFPRAGVLRGAIARRVVPTAAVPVESNRPHNLHGQCAGRVGQHVDLAIVDSSLVARKVSTRRTARSPVVRRGTAARS